MQDLKAVITDKTSIRFGLSTPTHEGNIGETFLSQELAINLLQVSAIVNSITMGWFYNKI